MGFFKKEVETSYGKKQVLNTGRIIIISIILFIALVTFFSSYKIIPSGYTGVKTMFQQVDENTVEHGFSWKIPYVQKIQKVNNKQQEITFKDTIWGESSERTVVYAKDVCITYRINPEYSAWIYANVTNYKQNALPNTLVASAIKASMVSLQSNEVTNRSKIEPVAVANLQSAIDTKYNGERVITIIAVNIDDMDFEESYNEAIAKKQIAQMQYEEQEIINNTAINKAEAEAKQNKISAETAAECKKITAQAEADAKVFEAEAEAEATKIIADAQADANKKLASSITPELTEYKKWTETWNGVSPKILGSDAIVDFGDFSD